jgi:uncharacterized damage-inducible protein DinB
MRAHDVIIQMLDTARFVTTTYLRDLSDEELLVRPVPGAHHIAWQLGHLLHSECTMIEGVRAGVAPQLPPRFAEHHSKEAANDNASEQFLSKEGYLALMMRVREATRSLLTQFSEEQFDAPGPEAMRSYAPTIGSIFLMIGSHEIMHSGQIAVLRRKLGKEVVI